MPASIKEVKITRGVSRTLLPILSICWLIQDDKLLASLMEANPTADWAQLSALFNAHAQLKKWPERSELALQHRPARTNVKVLLVAAAARKLSTDEACVTSGMLLPFLDSQGPATLDQLRLFGSSCSMLMRDSARKGILVTQLLQALHEHDSAPAGSEAWLSLLRQQEEVALLLSEPMLLAQMRSNRSKVTMQQVTDCSLS